MGLLCWENGNIWALGAVPALLVLLLPQPRVPRHRWEGWLFYAYYPAHLALLVALTPLVERLGSVAAYGASVGAVLGPARVNGLHRASMAWESFPGPCNSRSSARRSRDQ